MGESQALSTARVSSQFYTDMLPYRMRRSLGSVASFQTKAKKTKEIVKGVSPKSTEFVRSLVALGQRPVHSKETTVRQLEGVLMRSNETLASASTLVPFFPDTIILDRTKLTVERRRFFWSADVMSIRIEDILNVSATTGILFGSLIIATRVLSSDDHFRVDLLWREDAIHLKHMIQGYVIARHNNIETDELTRSELVHVLTELGQDTSR